MRREPKTNPGMKTRIGARPYRITTALGRDSKSPSEAFGSGQAPEASRIDSPATNELEASLASDVSGEFKKEGAVEAFLLLDKTGGAELPKYLYHGSPGDFDKLENRGEGIHLTVAPGLASAFAIPRDDIAKGRSGKIRPAQSIWNKPLKELRQPIKYHEVSVLPSRGAKNPVVPGETGKSSGFVYKIETRKILDQLHVNPPEPREIIFTGDSIPIKTKTPIEVGWATKRDPKLRGGAGVNTFARSLLKEAVCQAFSTGQAPELSQIDSLATDEFESALVGGAGGEFQKEGSSKPAVRTCGMEGCSNLATKGIIWADGRGVFHVCPDHVSAGKELLRKKNGDMADIVAVRNYDPGAPKGKRYSKGNSHKKEAAAVGDEFQKTGLSRVDQNYQRRIHRLNEKLKPGDILLTTRGLDKPGGSLTSRAATTVGERVAEGFGGEFHHTGLYVGGGKLVDARPRDGIQLRDVEKDLGNASIRVLRPDVTQKAKRLAIKKIKKKIGDSYSVLQAAKVWTGKLLGQVGDKRRAVKENICTNAVADAFRGSIDFGKERSLVGPWDIRASNQFKEIATMSGKGHKKIATVPALRPGPGEFAPGIPGERGIHNIPKVRPRADNPEWTASLSTHPAARRGDHEDLRLIDPKGRAHSWAFQEMPKPGKSTYAAQMPTHKRRYALRTEPYTIPEGYGATRPGAQVEPKFVSPVEVVEASNDKIRFLKHEGQQTQEFVVRRLVKAIGSVRPMWALHNATKNRGTGEGKKIPNYKPKYNEIAPESINLADSDQAMSPKLDGASVLVDLPGSGDKFARVYSYRPTARETGLIEHTFKFPDFQKRRGSEATKNTMIRAECWGTGKDGKAIPAEQLGGLLNAGVLKSRQRQKDMGVKLRLTGFDVVRHNGRNTENKPFAEKLEVLNRVQKATKGFVEAPEIAFTAEHKKSMLESVQSRSRKDTEEGVVLHSLTKALPPTKAKFKPDVDVYVRQVFDKPKGKAKGHAGGFGYAFTPDGPVIGRVGTGFDHATRKDMLENPDRYVGRVAKVKSVRNSENRTDPTQLTKALRAPSFQGWHLDKTDPKLMENDLEKRAVVEQLREGWRQLQEKASPEGVVDEAMARSRKLQRLKPFIRGAADLADAAEVPQSGVQSWIRKRLGKDA